ncbi:hypothetical protein BKA61DRAFT_616429 [Leptodontidium sp. MPI-SDFR-AT-0119]|nr:hypothetical protein BKA61DRAFT_616429 [Leptodontidium sp. MPI-SDFR-AT-0119]
MDDFGRRAAASAAASAAAENRLRFPESADADALPADTGTRRNSRDNDSWFFDDEDSLGPPGRDFILRNDSVERPPDMDFILRDDSVEQYSPKLLAAIVNPTTNSSSRPRASSFPLTFRKNGTFNRKSRPSVDPFAAWDDSALYNRYHTVMPVDDESILKLDIEKLRVAVRRTEMTDRPAASEDLVEQFSDQDTSTRSSSPWEQRDTSNPVTPAIDRSELDWRGPETAGGEWSGKVEAPNVGLDESSVSRLPPHPSGGNLAAGRFEKPIKYFRELSELGCRVYENSLFHKYIDGTKYRSFDGKITFEVPFIENSSIGLSTWTEILAFCSEVTNAANTQGSALQGSLERPHVAAYEMYDRVLAQLTHLIECRNIISGVWENIKLMKKAQYCADFISLLILDRTRRNVARLVRIECSTIEKLTTEFESCLFRTVCDKPEMVLAGNVKTYAKDVSTTCRQFLTDLGLEPQGIDMEDLWRCTVHLLDMAAVSYAGTHTHGLGNESVAAVVLPGPFFETQYYIFRRRKFSCLGNFLGSQEAWVLEDVGNWFSDIPNYFPDLVQVREPPPLYLSADAVTFGDIWGPMWKSSMVGNEVDIVRYNVGGGAIIPWNLPSLNAVQVKKGEVFCHWMANNGECEIESRAVSTNFLESDVLLIGAPIQLKPNNMCNVSSVEVREQLRNSESISQLGTARARWEQENRTITSAVTPPHMSLGYQQGWKLREGRSMNNSFIENWMNHPESRSVRSLELRLGLEVSTCTYNARRVRVIEVFQTNTMLNHLRDTSLKWKTKHQEASFFRALLKANHKAFGDLYESDRSWQPELGNAISCGLNMLQYTGKTKDDELQLFWVPERNQPGVCVTLRADDITWIGFLEETLSSGVMAVLENRCLELPPLTRVSRDTFNRIQNKPVLQTAIHLNDARVPKSLQGRYRENRNPESEYKGYWPIKYVEMGDIFSFGPRGRLETIARLGAGSRKDQILAVWRHPNGPKDIMLGIQHTLRQTAHDMPVLGRLVNRPPPPSQHHEVGQDSIDKESDTEPVHFHIVSATSRTVPHSHTPYRPQRARGRSNSGIEPLRPYEPGNNGAAIPRSMDANNKQQLSETLIAGRNVLREVQ